MDSVIRRGWWGEGWAWPFTLAVLTMGWVKYNNVDPVQFYINGGFYLTWGSLTWMMLEHGPTTLPSWGEGWLWPKPVSPPPPHERP